MTDDQPRSPLAGITAAMFAHISPAVYAELLERNRQNEKWGEQNHPDGTGPFTFPLTANPDELDVAFRIQRAEQLRKIFTDRCQNRFTANEYEGIRGTWADILLEEVFEALAESDPRALHAELIQVAAVATQWADAIQRRGRLL